MSRTTIYVADPTGEMRRQAEFSNSFWSAAMVWTRFAVRYLGVAEEDQYRVLTDKGLLRRVWDLAADEALPEADRITLCTTFDRFYVNAENFERVAAAMDATAKWLPEVCTIGPQAQFIRSLIGNAEALAVGWQQTSVSEDLWWIYPNNDGIDDDEGRPFNILTDDGATELFSASWAAGAAQERGPLEDP